MMYIATGLTKVLSNTSKEKMIALKHLDLNLKWKFCQGCNVSVDIMGVVIEQVLFHLMTCVSIMLCCFTCFSPLKKQSPPTPPTKLLFCIACKQDCDKVRFVKDNWVHAAFNFIDAMNEHGYVCDSKLGDERPSKEGDVLFRGKKVWKYEDFITYLVGVPEEGEEETAFKKKKTGEKESIADGWWNEFLVGKKYQQVSGERLHEDSPIFIFVDSMRKKDFGVQIALDIWSLPSTTLILIGNTSPKPTQTGWHLDWAHARNWAVLLQVSKLNMDHVIKLSVPDFCIFVVVKQEQCS